MSSIEVTTMILTLDIHDDWKTKYEEEIEEPGASVLMSSKWLVCEYYVSGRALITNHEGALATRRRVLHDQMQGAGNHECACRCSCKPAHLNMDRYVIGGEQPRVCLRVL